MRRQNNGGEGANADQRGAAEQPERGTEANDETQADGEVGRLHEEQEQQQPGQSGAL